MLGYLYYLKYCSWHLGNERDDLCLAFALGVGNPWRHRSLIPGIAMLHRVENVIQQQRYPIPPKQGMREVRCRQNIPLPLGKPAGKESASRYDNVKGLWRGSIGERQDRNSKKKSTNEMHHRAKQAKDNGRYRKQRQAGNMYNMA
ncbi:hypothetical protein Tco_0745019 [Tanacetum coccineum]